jgi:hypothetical protein
VRIARPKVTGPRPAAGRRVRAITDSGVITGFLNHPTTAYKGFVTKLQGSSAYQAVPIPDASLLSPLQGATVAPSIANDGVVSGTASDSTGNSHGFIAVAK